MNDDKQPLTAPKPHVYHEKKRAIKKQRGGISEGQLVFIGLASILGAGFFLATATTIRETGLSILLSYLIGVFAVWTIFDAFGAMLAAEPGHRGSFLYFVEKYLGGLFAFVGGWIYWASGVMTMSSEITGISIFTQKWLPSVPIWLLSCVYALLALGINGIGMKNYGRVESLFAILKSAALVVFIGIVFYFILGGREGPPSHFTEIDLWFTHGLTGFLTSLSMMFFTFGGIIATGLATAEVEMIQIIPRAFRKIVFLLASLYLVSLFAVLYVTPVTEITPKRSPMVTTLSLLRIPFADEVLNGIMITAAFSTAIAAMFGVSHILVNLSKRHEAPAVLAKINHRGVPVPSLLVTTVFLFITIVASYFLPGAIYELLTTSAGVVFLLLWGMILFSFIKFKNAAAYRSVRVWGFPWRIRLSLSILAVAFFGTVFDKRHLISMLISMVFAATAGIFYRFFFGKMSKAG